MLYRTIALYQRPCINENLYKNIIGNWQKDRNIDKCIAGAETGTAGGIVSEADVGIAILKATARNKDVNIG